MRILSEGIDEMKGLKMLVFFCNQAVAARNSFIDSVLYGQPLVFRQFSAVTSALLPPLFEAMAFIAAWCFRLLDIPVTCLRAIPPVTIAPSL